MQARELMTPDPGCCTPEQTVRDAAQIMLERDCGCVPVVQDTDTNRLVGVVTDRDIACRCVAAGQGGDTPVRDVMTREPTSCAPEDDVKTVERIMMQEQVRRVPVVDGQGSCVGIIAQADLARNQRAASDRDVGRVVEEISQPAHQAGARS